MSEKPYVRRFLIQADLAEIVTLLLAELGYQPKITLEVDYGGSFQKYELERIKKGKKRGRK